LSPWTRESRTPEPNRLDVTVESRDLPSAVRALDEAGWGYLAGITGLDQGVEPDIIEVLYHFCEGAAVVTIRVHTPRECASVPTICDIIPSATLYERELAEMLGVEVQGMDYRVHLFLPDDWPPDVYPLRKDAALE
jgi:Ni,Fe-hydrogenase III component G